MRLENISPLLGINKLQEWLVFKPLLILVHGFIRRKWGARFLLKVVLLNVPLLLQKNMTNRCLRYGISLSRFQYKSVIKKAYLEPNGIPPTFYCRPAVARLRLR